jgi:hypothetical protein
MKTKIDALPNWAFEIDEVSAVVYTLIATHPLGCRIDLTGTDPDDLIEQAKTSAEAMEKDVQKKRMLDAS